MQRKKRYQQGSIEKLHDAQGVYWAIRFADRTPGNPSRPRFRIGSLTEFPTKAKAERSEQAKQIRETFNAAPDLLLIGRRTFSDVIQRYRKEEMPARHSTRRGYDKMLRVHIEPRWDKVGLSDIKPLDVRAWLRKLPLSGRSKGHLHGMVRVLFRFAMLWEWVPTQQNPMSLFSLEGSTKRVKQPDVITETQFRDLLEAVDMLIADKELDATDREPMRLVLIAAMCLGLRCGELLALCWSDFDFEAGRLRVQRAIVEGRVGNVTTVHSGKPLPLDERVAATFRAWRAHSDYCRDDDWVFANPNCNGETPFYPNNLQPRLLTPLAKKVGLPFKLGFQTFRHSYKTWLDAKEVPLTVQRDLMRHSDIRTTAQVYGQVRVEQLREANTDVVDRAFTVN